MPVCGMKVIHIIHRTYYYYYIYLYINTNSNNKYV